MELRHLRYFAAVAQYLNYTEASRRLHVAQPAISQTILDLEDELGVELLLRTKRSVQLTAAGTAFLREAEEILRRANEARQLAQRAARGEVGILGIGFFGTASSPLLPALVQAYRRKFPNVELRLFELNPDQQLAAFDEGRIDLGFTRTLPSDRRAEFEEEVVYTDQLAIALPAAHALAKQKVIRLKSLAGEPFVQFHRKGAPGLFDEVIAVCRRAGFSPRIINEPNFMATAMTLVESGLGVSLIPRCVRSLNRSQVVIRPIAPKSARIPLCVAWRKSTNNPALAAFLDILRAATPAIRTQMES
ncbi:MAG TPA: LysR substrate-binding domain-containing protein [Candidatus Binatia bacterium]|jgi:DNA-binding transcriptional LysR family regulator|nr:LysR substrate-binding domain-containing protein [Candidatus Binatia bacterium]